nr:hypothetical protein [Escherichia coli O25b:H4-ST131]
MHRAPPQVQPDFVFASHHRHTERPAFRLLEAWQRLLSCRTEQVPPWFRSVLKWQRLLWRQYAAVTVDK